MTYNGWSNYETWVVNLWIDNEQSSQEMWRHIAIGAWEDTHYNSQDSRIKLAEILKDTHESESPELEGMYADLLNAALGEVDWLELADNMLSDMEGYERNYP